MKTEIAGSIVALSVVVACGVAAIVTVFQWSVPPNVKEYLGAFTSIGTLVFLYVQFLGQRSQGAALVEAKNALVGLQVAASQTTELTNQQIRQIRRDAAERTYANATESHWQRIQDAIDCDLLATQIVDPFLNLQKDWDGFIPKDPLPSILGSVAPVGRSGADRYEFQSVRHRIEKVWQSKTGYLMAHQLTTHFNVILKKAKDLEPEMGVEWVEGQQAKVYAQREMAQEARTKMHNLITSICSRTM